MAIRIPEYLIEAYMGRFECSRKDAIDKIERDLPRDHLETYLEWQGIIGYNQILYTLANGSWYNNRD